MKKHFYIFLFSFLLFLATSIAIFFSSSENSLCSYDYVEKVYDGDTIYTSRLGKIRLLGIDSPEIYHPGLTLKYYKFYGCGNISKKIAEKLILHKQILICKDKLSKDKGNYGRKLRYAMIKIKDYYIPIGLIEVYLGYAKVYRYGNFSLLGIYDYFEKKAKEKKLGIWGEKCIKKDEEFRKKHNLKTPQENKKCNIKGNISSKSGKKLYYLPSDKNYSKVKINESKGEKYFCTKEEAEKAGFTRIKDYYTK